MVLGLMVYLVLATLVRTEGKHQLGLQALQGLLAHLGNPAAVQVVQAVVCSR